MLTIKEASEFLGVSVPTMRRWEKEGRITSYRTNGNHRRYDKNDLVRIKCRDDDSFKITVAYCRVSLLDQKKDLQRQIDNVTNYCIAKGYQFKVISDLGSGLSYNKKGLKELISLICSEEIDKIVVNYKDRLIRFGYEMIEQLCSIYNVKIEVINHTENEFYEEELVEDALSVITEFSSKLYGSKSYKSKKIKDINTAMFKYKKFDCLDA